MLGSWVKVWDLRAVAGIKIGADEGILMGGIPQPMMPRGFVGRMVGWSMDLLNRHAFRTALDTLAVQPGDSILEIGFGTGALIRILAERASEGFVAGVDPSRLMLETASRRSARAIESGRVELRLGDASRLDWPNGRFDKVCAVHSFQFWAEPATSLGEVNRVLAPGGLLLLILRSHGGGKADGWLPNPISHAGDEMGETLGALREGGFVGCEALGRTRNSFVIVGRKP